MEKKPFTIIGPYRSSPLRILQLWLRLADLFLNTTVKIEGGVTQNPTIDTLTKIPKVLEVVVGDLIK